MLRWICNIGVLSVSLALFGCNASVEEVGPVEPGESAMSEEEVQKEIQRSMQGVGKGSPAGKQIEKEIEKEQ